MPASDTIAAVATPPGRGGIGVIRISGADVSGLARQLIGGLPPARQAVYRAFRNAGGRILDRGIALYFPAPHSFTGENVLELQGHGGPAVLDGLLSAVLEQGARHARPGEFSERAFLNDKLDLAQAEAVADLIAADSHAAAQAAMRSLEGSFSKEVNRVLQRLIDLRVYVEAALDFPDEEIDFLADGEVLAGMESLILDMQRLLEQARSGLALQEGLRVVITGRPNAGKSSLLNALVQRDAAIVTDIAGTTRDALELQVNLQGLPLTLIDTAGLRLQSDDPIEQEGMRRAREQARKAQHLLLMVDDNDEASTPAQALLQAFGLPADCPFTVLRNKCDLSGRLPGPIAGEPQSIALCALSGEGIPVLVERLHAQAGLKTTGAGNFSARRRHLDALTRSLQYLQAANQVLAATQAGELAAEELGRAQQALGEITGRFHSEDLLGAIFSSFCIGK